MGSADVIRSCLDAIRQVAEDLADGVVYLDAGCLEAFQLVGAFPLILDIGARAVCSLENMSSLDVVANWNSQSSVPATKIVIITTRLLNDAHRYILRCLSTHQTIVDCRIFTSISEVSHSACASSPLGPDAFREYESLLFMDYEDLLKKGSIPTGPSNSDRSRLRISVCHFPMVFCPLSPRFFVLPSESAIAEASLSDHHVDSISPGLPMMSGSRGSDDEIPPGATLTAHFLYYFALKMDLKLEIFSLGDSSKNIGKILTDMSSLYDVGRRKKSAGLLIVDRSLDLLTPCCHGDSAFDWVISSVSRSGRIVKSSSLSKKSPSTLVQRPRLDVKLPLDKVLEKEEMLLNNFAAFASGWDSGDVEGSENESGDRKTGFLTGSLVSVDNYKGVNYLEVLLDRGMKEGAMLVKKWLLGVIRENKVPANLKNRLAFPSGSELLSLAKLLASNQGSFVKNRDIIQLAVASFIALSEPFYSHWNALSSSEKVLKMSCRDSSQSLSNQIRDIIDRSVSSRSNGQNLISFHDSLLLSVVGYILAGVNFPTSGSSSPFSWEEEHSLKESVMEAILELPTVKNLSFLHGMEEELESNYRKKKDGILEETAESFNPEDLDDNWASWGEDQDSDQNNEQEYGEVQLKLELRDRVDQLFKLLHKISGLRSRNSAVRDIEGRFDSETYVGKGLLYKIMLMVLAKYDVPGLGFHSSAVGRILKSGLGRFGLGQAKPNLGDQSTIIVFVVGGVCGHEIREMQEAISESGRPDVELLIGGTTLLTPSDMFDLIFGSSGFM
ncbi:vesicle docking protein isoform X2 [Wolffia australiana]